MRTQPLSSLAAGLCALVVLLVWTLGLAGGGLAGEPVTRLVDKGGPAAVLWQLACVGAGVFVVLAARPALSRVDPQRRRGAAAWLLQLGGVGLVLVGLSPAAEDGSGGGSEGVPLTAAEAEPALGAIGALLVGVLLPAAAFLLAARWRTQARREAVVCFVGATVALWALLGYSLDPTGESGYAGLAQRVAFTAALGWLAWLFARSVDPEAPGLHST